MPTGTSNTRECITGFFGQKLKGVLIGALPLNAPDIAKGTVALVFEEGTALVFSSQGSWWTAPREDVQRAVARLEEDLRKTEARLRELLTLASETTQRWDFPSEPSDAL